MKIQDNYYSILTSNKYGTNNISNISNRYMAAAMKYQAMMMSDGKEKGYYDFKTYQKEDDLTIDKDIFVDQSRMNSLKQYDRYVDVRDNDNAKVKVKVR